MKFAIISAGEGSRLAQEGVQLPKPLVQLNGMAMIDRLIHIFAKNGAEEVVVIINNEVALTKNIGSAFAGYCQDNAQLHAQFLRTEPLPEGRPFLSDYGRHDFPGRGVFTLY
mgnify:CR=1 FL=1